MKKLVFVAVVLAMTMGGVSETQAFWGFFKKANVEVKNEQAENNMGATVLAIKGESETAKLVISKEGTSGFSLLAGGAKVLSNTAGTLTARILTAEVSFGSSKVTLTINTNADTKVYRAYDGRSAIFDAENIAVGDTLSFEGVLNSTDSSLTITARKIKDYSAQARDANYSGVIKSINLTANTFVLDLSGNVNDSDERVLTVSTTTKTIIHKFSKKTGESNAPMSFSELKVGDIVKSVTGVVNTQTMQMTASKIVISERGMQGRKIKDVFATVVSVDRGNSMVVKSTTNVVYTVSFLNSNTVYNKWTISQRYSGVKKGSKTDGVTETSTLDGLALVKDNKVWISGDLDTKINTVVPSLIEKEFYK